MKLCTAVLKSAFDQLRHTPRTITAGPSSPTRSLPAAPADSGEHGAAYAQQPAASLPASSIPGSPAHPHAYEARVSGAPAQWKAAPYGGDTSQGHSPQRRRQLILPATSGLTVSTDQMNKLKLSRLINAYLR